MVTKAQFLLALGLFALCSSGISAQSEDWDGKLTKVSLIQLIATPERYWNKNIEVVGILSIEPDRVSLFPTQESYRAYDQPSSVLILRGAIRSPSRDEFEGRLVSVSGRFEQASNAHGVFARVYFLWRIEPKSDQEKERAKEQGERKGSNTAVQSSGKSG